MVALVKPDIGYSTHSICCRNSETVASTAIGFRASAAAAPGSGVCVPDLLASHLGRVSGAVERVATELNMTSERAKVLLAGVAVACGADVLGSANMLALELLLQADEECPPRKLLKLLGSRPGDVAVLPRVSREVAMVPGSNMCNLTLGPTGCCHWLTRPQLLRHAVHVLASMDTPYESLPRDAKPLVLHMLDKFDYKVFGTLVFLGRIVNKAYWYSVQHTGEQQQREQLVELLVSCLAPALRERAVGAQDCQPDSNPFCLPAVMWDVLVQAAHMRCGWRVLQGVLLALELVHMDVSQIAVDCHDVDIAMRFQGADRFCQLGRMQISCASFCPFVASKGRRPKPTLSMYWC